MSEYEPDDDEHTYSLVMPFVVTKSTGGPFDDDAYCAGWEMGKLAAQLSTETVLWVATVLRAANLPQADLIAMDAGWTMTVAEPPEEMSSVEADSHAAWAHVTFSRAGQP